jgi:hypothetical protein
MRSSPAARARRPSGDAPFAPALSAAAALVVALAGAAGCLNVSTSAANPTAIERQLLGAYAALDRDLVLEAAARGAEAGPSAEVLSRDPLRARAVEARAVMLFNADDLDELRRDGCVVEVEGARVERRRWARADSDPRADALARRVVDEENTSREALLAFAAAARARDSGRARLEPAEIEELRRALARLVASPAER